MDFHTEERFSDYTPTAYSIVRSVYDSSNELRNVLAPVKTSNVSVPIDSIFRVRDSRDVVDSPAGISSMFILRVREMGDRMQYRPIKNVKFLSSVEFQYDVEHVYDMEIQNTGPFVLNKDEAVYVLPSIHIRDKIEPYYFQLYGETYQHELIVPQHELTLFLKDLYDARKYYIELDTFSSGYSTKTKSTLASFMPDLFNISSNESQRTISEMIRILGSMNPMGTVYSRVEYGEGMMYRDENKHVLPGSKFMIRLASGF